MKRTAFSFVHEMALIRKKPYSC